MKYSVLSIFLSLILLACSGPDSKNIEPALIPYPASIQMGKGQFNLNSKTGIILNDNNKFANEYTYLQSLLQSTLGTELKMEKGANNIIINYTDTCNHPEAYTLKISPETIEISAKDAAGMFYALQTLRQLLPSGMELGETVESVSLPVFSAYDYPAFGWRGMHLDVSRHFFSMDYLKKHLDRMALYKFNKFHLHLTDDQGWRIEIKKYPKLTEEGAWRTFNNQDSACIKRSTENPDFEIDQKHIITRDGKQLYGGFYTQEQIKELVQYAQSRHIEIIPEIDMPGHMMAAISSYPFLTSTGKIGWGKDFSIPICPCKDETYTFIEDILSEIMQLFPSQYIHIGADEVEKSTWSESPQCKALMNKEKLQDVKQLQSYFVHRVQQYIISKGKQTIGWDEVLEGGINPEMNIMYWRAWVKDAPVRAVNNGNKVIMTPTNHLYFDYLPNKSTLYNVYFTQVIPSDIPQDKSSLIQGAQANLWTEMIPSEKRAEFMIFPRMTALAERVWTNQDKFESYNSRLLSHYERWDRMKINYRLPDLQNFAQESVFTDKTYFNVKSPLENMQIHYTTDGNVPTLNSPALTTALTIDKPCRIRFALFSPGGARSEIYEVKYKQTAFQKPVSGVNTQPGLVADFYDGFFNGTTKIKEEKDKQFTVSTITVPKDAETSTFAIKFNGYIQVPETGIYSFFLICDDAGVLKIADQLVVDNDGMHSPVEKSGQVALEKGSHPFNLNFVEGGGGYTLKLQYSLNGSEPVDIPANWLLH